MFCLLFLFYFEKTPLDKHVFFSPLFSDLQLNFDGRADVDTNLLNDSHNLDSIHGQALSTCVDDQLCQCHEIGYFYDMFGET